MDFLLQLLDYFTHMDAHLTDLLRQYDGWTYAILFLIIFCETGLVVTPLPPGDSLLFAAVAVVASANKPGDPALNIFLLWVLLMVAAIIGDSVNYQIGRWLGLRVFKEDAKIMKMEYLRRTEAFYAKHGGKTKIGRAHV